MAEHLICDSYLFKFKNKRTNIGKKRQRQYIKQRTRNQTDKKQTDTQKRRTKV